MDPRLRTRIEIETIHAILPELDYYQLLALARDCAQNDIDGAFRTETRRLHPDRVTAGAPEEFKAVANTVFKAVNDAYRVLRDPDSRARYDAERRQGDRRMSDEARRAAEADAAQRSDPARAARTEKGGKYWKMALQNWNDGDFNGCIMNINFALTFEPDNATFKDYIARAKAAFEEKKKEAKIANAYKIRIS